MTIGVRGEPDLLAIRHGDSAVELELELSPDLVYFRGHFPNFPVLPGIVQLHWTVCYARRFFAVGSAPVRSVKVKFRNVIAPSERLTLALRDQGEGRRIVFEYRGAGGMRSSGQVTFAS
jgi:3-hydroxymyristoyl/3-hydroxydecanoyl-(acyl carrier protein) dehydratase